jgi:hypothetical protein
MCPICKGLNDPKNNPIFFFLATHKNILGVYSSLLTKIGKIIRYPQAMKLFSNLSIFRAKLSDEEIKIRRAK